MSPLERRWAILRVPSRGLNPAPLPRRTLPHHAPHHEDGSMIACAAFAVAAAVMCVAPARAAPLDPAQVRIVKIAMPDLPDVHLRAIIFSGSADDPPGREGLASFTANLMRRGAESPHPEERNGAPTPKIGSFDVSVGK